MDKNEKVSLIIDFVHRLAFHYVLWFLEIERQLGKEKALECLNKVYGQANQLLFKKLSKALNFDLEKNGFPTPLLMLDDPTLDELIKTISVSWLANDGLWFQAVEFERNMIDAKRCNDSCWAQFSPIEANFIKRFLGLSDDCGLEGLEKALGCRLYTFINKQTVRWHENALILEVNSCRVQDARNRKNLEEYPCKSGGFAEFSRFAETIDRRIKTSIIACPPDKHPDEYFCAWKFFID
jgi:hypothetical protein